MSTFAVLQLLKTGVDEFKIPIFVRYRRFPDAPHTHTHNLYLTFLDEQKQMTLHSLSIPNGLWRFFCFVLNGSIVIDRIYISAVAICLSRIYTIHYSIWLATLYPALMTTINEANIHKARHYGVQWNRYRSIFLWKFWSWALIFFHF